MKTKTILLLALAAACLLTACNQKSAEPANITLTVKPGSKIYLSFAGVTDSTPVHIRNGRLDTTIIVGTERTPARYFIANKGKMTIRGRLTLFNCSTNGSVITALDCSRDTLLQNLECNHNALTELNVSGCTSLRVLECYANRLDTLNLSGSPILERLNCSDNLLTKLVLPSPCKELILLSCINNKLTQLDITTCSKLQRLNCSNNELIKLQLLGCNDLSIVNCEKNKLTELDFSGCVWLTTVFCCQNNFSYDSIEMLYNSLPDRTTDDEPGHITILDENALSSGRTNAGNEGIATKKHWEVLWCQSNE